MTQLCIAHHPDNPPRVLGGLRLCPGHHHALEDALTGPSAAADPTIEAAWGVRHYWDRQHWGDVVRHGTAAQARAARHAAEARYTAIAARLARQDPPVTISWQPPIVVCSDGTTWVAPQDYRPGGLARDWAALELRGPALRTGEPAPFITSSADPGLPVDERVAELRSQILYDLDWWARDHADHLAVTPPAPTTVHQVVAWLARYRDWAAAQPFAGEYVAVLTELRGRVHRLIDLPQPARHFIGPCLERRDGQHCTGQLWTRLREPGDPALPVIRCDTCSTTYDSTQWESLRNRLTRGNAVA